MRGESGGCKVCVRPPRQAPHVGSQKLLCATFRAVAARFPAEVSYMPLRDLSRGGSCVY